MGEQFQRLASESTRKKTECLDRGFYAPVPHDLFRRIVPIAREYDKANVHIVTLYTYLLSMVNGQPDNDRYMSAFPSVMRIADETGIGRNRVKRLCDVLEAVGLVKSAMDYTSNKRDKLYYPQYYSALTDEEIRRNLDEIYRYSPESELPKSL
ncbi:hypothetical protein PASE110613_09175 [Paenibacillus sediminis]|uniref:Helix-turn-helix domain-containing protein n=1 Tax=Paenibacillus sediminis TaxID=664909 RepID=A0ABS4H6T3_9BACL|nr:hypothetical protein [Paenibacillus sediminis]MBP1938181.1 hypothetical protein [Paenibacillus sediminis]